MEQHSYFNRIYEETHRDILRWIVIKTNRANDVEDLLQEVYRSFYARLLRHGARDILDAKRYLIAIAKKELARFYRNKSARRENECAFDDAVTEDAEQALDERFFTAEAARRVWALVRQEPLLSYKAFTLYYGFSMRIAEIAAALGVTEAAVKQRLMRTRNHIRAELKGERP